MLKDTRAKDAAEERHQLERTKKQRLRSLNKDSTFLLETAKIKQDLTRLWKEKAALVDSIFRHLPYLLIYRPNKLTKLLGAIKDRDAAKVFRAYVKYASRFQVRLRRRRRSFHVEPILPLPTMYHFIIKGGRLKAMRDELSGETEPVVEDITGDEDLDVPTELADLLTQGRTKVVQVDDRSGSSVLNQLEGLVYDADALTFILHHTPQQKYIFCLVGEKVATDTTWRSAGKAVNALQKKFYGRQKAGRPVNVQRLKHAVRIRQHKGRKQFKERAFELTPKKFVDEKLETQQHYLSDVGRKLKRLDHRK